MPAVDLSETRDEPDAQSPVKERSVLAMVAVMVPIGICALLLILAMNPAAFFTNTLPAGTDLSAHVYPISSAWERLTSGQSFVGWDEGWFDGFVGFRYYPPAPAFIVGLLSMIMPFLVAYKVVVVLSVLLVPVCGALLAWRVCKSWSAVTWSVIGLTAYMLTNTCYLCGGTLLSAVTGEFYNVLGIAAALWALSEFVGVMRGERPRVLLAIALGIAALCHPMSTLWLALAMATTLLVVLSLTPELRDWRALGRRIGIPVVIGAALASVWWLPFLGTREWMTAPFFPEQNPFGVFSVIPLWPVLVILAVVGAIYAMARNQMLGLILTGTGIICLLIAMALEAGLLSTDGALWNLRFMPYVLLSTYWLAILGVEFLTRQLNTAESLRYETISRIGACVVLVVVTAWTWGGVVPGISTEVRRVDQSNGNSPSALNDVYTHTFGPFTWTSLGIAASASERLRGMEAYPEWPQMKQLIDEADRLTQANGCATFLVEQNDFYEANNARAPWPYPYTSATLPYWTNGCARSLTGLMYDSSFLTPAITMTDGLVSNVPEPFGTWTANQAPDLVRGIVAMSDLSVSYYVTREEWAANEARQVGFEEVSTVGPWVFFATLPQPVVQPLARQPYVITDPTTQADVIDHTQWQRYASQYIASEFSATDRFTLGGPADWPRVNAGTVPDPVDLPPITVSNIVVDGPNVSFDVDKTGVPVLIRRVPNADWVATGATAPLVINPGFLTVTPTANRVELKLEQPSSAMWGNWLGAAGLLGVIGLAVFDGWFNRREEEEEEDATEVPTSA